MLTSDKGKSRIKVIFFYLEIAMAALKTMADTRERSEFSLTWS